MSAPAKTLRDDLTARGIKLSRNGDRLHVEGKPGTITAEVKAMLIEHKAELLVELAARNDDPVADLRARLTRIAEVEGIDSAIVRDLPDDDVPDCAGQSHDTLRAYVLALHDTAERMAGRVPKDETTAALCRRCGPVWIHPSVAAVAPLLMGWPRLLGCPWCHVHHAGKYVPRPGVTCNTCQHFTRNTINPEGGMGTCTAGVNPSRPWPHVERNCGKWQPSG